MCTEIPKWCRVGYFIDAKDSMNEWCAAEVKEVNKMYVSIILDGWSSKWETSVPIKSQKIAPFRKQSRGYTGPKAKGYRNWEFSPEILQRMHEKVSCLLSSDLQCEDAFHTTQYYRGHLFMYLDNLLSQKPTAEVIPPILNFCADVMRLIVRWLQISPVLFPYYYQGLVHGDLYLEDNKVALASIWYELLDVLKKLFGLDTRSSDFFHTADLITETAAVHGSPVLSMYQKSKTAMAFVASFAKEGGCEAILAIVRNEDEKSRVPFGFLNQLAMYEINDYLNTILPVPFFSQYTEAILRRIDIVSESELKDLRYEELIILLTRMKRFNHQENPFIFELLKLNFFLKMLRSGYLEKRIKALSEISSMIETLDMRATAFDIHKVRSHQEQLKNWLVGEKVLSLLLTDRPHVELMKRSSIILKFFAKQNLLDNSCLEELWKSISCKHESYIRATYETIVDLASVLKENQSDYLFSEFLKVPKENYDESFLVLIKDFTVKAINMCKSTSIHSPNQKWYGISIFQELLLDSSPAEFRFTAIKYLVFIIAETYSFPQKLQCYKLIRKLIRENNSVTQALKLFLTLQKHTPRVRIDQNECKCIEKIYRLTDVIIENLSKYLNSLATSVPDTSYSAQFNHSRYLHIRLQFLGIAAHNSSAGLSFENLEQLWDIFTQHNNIDKELFFMWLYQGIKCKVPITANQLHNVFHNFFLQEDRFSNSCESLYYFNSFSYFFCEANRMDSAIELTDSKQIKYRRTKKIKGTKKLLNILLHTSNELVMEKSGRLIFAILSRFEPDLLEEAEDIVMEFVEDLLRIIQANKTSDSLVMRGLLLIKILIDKLEDDHDYNSFVYAKKINGKEFSSIKINQNKNIRHLRKEIARHYSSPLEHTQLIINDRRISVCDDDLDIQSIRYSYIDVDFVDEEITEYNPFCAIKQSQDVIRLLFELLSDANKIYTELAWRLLLALPTCKSLKKSLSQLKSPIHDLIDLSSTHKLLYALKIVLKKSNNQCWVDRFSLLGGTQYLIDIFTGHSEDSPLRLVALKEEIILPVLANIIETIQDDYKFIEAFFRSYEHVARAAACGEKIEDEKSFFQSLKKILGIIGKCSADSLLSFLQKTSIRSLLVHIFIECSNSNFVEHSIIIFQKLCKIPDCFEYVYSQCNLLLELSVRCASKSSGYWDLFSDQIQKGSSAASLTQITLYLIEELQRRPSEVNSMNKDEILCGILKVLGACWRTSEVSPTTCHVDLLLMQCLCEIPNGTSPSSEAPPKCKHPDTRTSGFKLLLELCKSSPAFLSEAVHRLDPFHQDPAWRSSRKADWMNSPVSKEKSQTGYVGLKNLGCTCYMNSILQQLFMIDTFRDSILRCPSEASEDNLLYQLQYVFSGLRSSDKQYISPKGFTRAFKDSEGNAINIIEQMDVDEFFGSFMDKLESLVKNTQYSELIKLHFGGLQVTELIGKECPHRSERHEPFLSISVEVKNKRSLQEGLESYVAEEVLEGENSYQCDHCEAKVKAIRRVCVKHLPNYLIIALRRFEFDFDTMSREKLNDYFEFPFELDMEPYTQEGLESDKEKKPKEYYAYRLRGIVIHTGTAESGHYYSYISNNKAWIEFNDIWISQVNPENIPNDCYGGEEKFQYNAYSKIAMREKLGNAYMLIYERASMYNFRGPDDENLETIELQVNNLEQIEESREIKKQNQKYWRSKIIFGPEYLSFVCGLSKIEFIDTKFLVKFYLTILIRNKEKKIEIFEIYSRIENDLKVNDNDIADWFLDLVSYEDVTKEILILCPIYLMRRIIVGLVKTALSSASTAAKLMFSTNLVQSLCLARKKYSKNYAQYLEVLKLSIIAAKDLENMYDFITIILEYILNMPIALPEEIPHLHADIDLGYRDCTSQESIRDDGFHTDIKGTSQCHTFQLLYTFREKIPENFQKILKNGKIITQFIADSDNKISCLYLGKLCAFLCSNNKTSALEVEWMLLEQLRNSELAYKNKITRILIQFLAFEDPLQQEKIDLFVESSWQSLRNVKCSQENEHNISCIYKVCSRVPAVLEALHSRSEILVFIDRWIKSNMIIIVPTRNENSMPEEHIKTSFRSLISKFEKIKKKDMASTWNSDEEFLEENIEIGQEIDVYDISIASWIKAKVEHKAGDILNVSYDWHGDEMQVLKDSQGEEVAPPDTKSKYSYIN